jgi:hypothetical protein
LPLGIELDGFVDYERLRKCDDPRTVKQDTTSGGECGTEVGVRTVFNDAISPGVAEKNRK